MFYHLKFEGWGARDAIQGFRFEVGWHFESISSFLGLGVQPFSVIIIQLL